MRSSSLAKILQCRDGHGSLVPQGRGLETRLVVSMFTIWQNKLAYRNTILRWKEHKKACFSMLLCYNVLIIALPVGMYMYTVYVHMYEGARALLVNTCNWRAEAHLANRRSRKR